MATIVLGGLAIYDAADITVAVAEVPGRAIVVTRACYDELLEKHTQGLRVVLDRSALVRGIVFVAALAIVTAEGA